MERAIRAVVALCLAGGISLLVAAPAFAQEIDGGCSAQVNGRDPSSMTEDEPLVLKKNRRVDVRGSAPASAGGGKNQTNLSVVVFGGKVPVETIRGEGAEWGGRAEVPGYLKTFAPGVYRVEGEASGSGWSCTASGYIELKGGPWTVAAGVGAVLGLIGTALAIGSRGSAPDKAAVGRTLGVEHRRMKIEPDRLRNAAADLIYLLLLALAFFLAYEEFADFGDSLGFAVPAAAASGRQRVRSRGRVIRGFIGGLLLGIGAALLLHQFDVWTLDLNQGLVFPVLVAVLTAIRAGVGGWYFATPPPAEVDDRVLEPVGGGPPPSAMEASAPAPTGSEATTEAIAPPARDVPPTAAPDQSSTQIVEPAPESEEPSPDEERPAP